MAFADMRRCILHKAAELLQGQPGAPAMLWVHRTAALAAALAFLLLFSACGQPLPSAAQGASPAAAGKLAMEKLEKESDSAPQDAYWGIADYPILPSHTETVSDPASQNRIEEFLTEKNDVLRSIAQNGLDSATSVYTMDVTGDGAAEILISDYPSADGSPNSHLFEELSPVTAVYDLATTAFLGEIYGDAVNIGWYSLGGDAPRCCSLECITTREPVGDTEIWYYCYIL